MVLNETDKLRDLIKNVETQKLKILNEELPDNDTNFHKIISQIFEKEVSTIPVRNDNK